MSIITSKTIIVSIISIILSYILVIISRNIGYEYGSKKREILSVVLTGIYVSILTYFTRISYSAFTVKGEIYFALFVIAAIISISSSFVDFKYKEIPDSYNLATAVLGVISIIIFPAFFNTAILTGGIMFGIYLLIMLVTNALGGGDVKMAGALGLLIPISKLNLFLISPFAFGTVIALYLIFIKKQDKNNKIPFGPYITLGYLFTIFMYLTV